MHAEDFFGLGIPLKPGAIEEAAFQLNVEPAVLQAIAKKESRSSGFIQDGRPVILFEPHKFHEFTEGKYDDMGPSISSTSYTLNRYGPSGAYQYQKLEKAMALDETAALMSCSWGRFQIMGFNYKACAFNSVQEMVKAFCESEQKQLDAFVSFLLSAGLLPALRQKDWQAIARKYNGPAYKTNNYDSDLKRYYDELTGHFVRQGSSGPQVETLQKLLNAHGAKPPVAVDGFAGPATVAAIKAFQEKTGVVVDGIAGPQTFAALAAVKADQTSLTKSKRVAGAAPAAGAGAVATGVGLTSLVEQVQSATAQANQVATTVARASKQEAVIKTVDIVENLSRQNQFQSMLIILLGLLLIAMAGYIVWTKMADIKKLMGVR